MKRLRTRIHLPENGLKSLSGIRAAASLHCHTHFSREILSFIPWYAERTPIVARYFRSALDKYREAHGRDMDFSQAWWTPPVSPREVVEMESLQIEKSFGLAPLVSITDHDDIEAGMQLQVLNCGSIYPISMEWTVPWLQGFFHLGVHNLPPESASELKSEMLKYTSRDPESLSLTDLLEWLNGTPGVLVVLNHPLWDIELIGGPEHRGCLQHFLGEHTKRLDALEINGFRSWVENRQTLLLAEDLGLPVVSGGDRHGCQPNTIVNLTSSTSFEGLVDEIREDRHSEVVILPAYRESMPMRALETVAEVIGHYEGHMLGREQWSDRIFFTTAMSGTRSLTEIWPDGGPGWVKGSLWLLRLLGSRRMKPALRLGFSSERVNYEYEG